MRSSACRLLAFFSQNKGSIAISFAFILPTLVAFFTLIFDGARFNYERSRLTDALNQSAYALMIMDNKNATSEDKENNISTVASYLSYYLPGITIDKSTITVDEHLSYGGDGLLSVTDYKVSAEQITHPILNFYANSNSNIPSFSKDVVLRGNSLSGATTRREERVPTDYVFVVDFSGKWASSSYVSLDSDGNYATYAQLIRRAIIEVSKQVLDLGDGSTIGFVPYSDGVYVPLDKTNYASPQGKAIGCSYIAKLKSDYDSFDWDFWYNKPNSEKLVSIMFPTYNKDYYKTKTNDIMYNYYKNVIAKSYNISDSEVNDWLVNQGYCTAKPYSYDENDCKTAQQYYPLLADLYCKTDMHYNCDADSNSSLLNSSNEEEFNKNLWNFLYFGGYADSTGSILNTAVVDIEGTLSGDFLFKESNIKNVISFMDGDSNSGSALGSCSSILNYDGTFNGNSVSHLSEIIQDITKPPHYPLDLSSNPSVITEFNAMENNLTDRAEPLWGLLRAVPLLAKGHNKRKVMIVIEAGGGVGDLSTDPNIDSDSNRLLAYLLGDRYGFGGLCDVIRDGLKKYPEGTSTTSSSVYYVSFFSDPLKIVYWANSCTGKNGSYSASYQYSRLVSILESLVFPGNVSYINPNE